MHVLANFQVVSNFLNQKLAEENLVYFVCKYCGAKIDTYVESWQNQESSGMRTVINCRNQHCTKTRDNGYAVVSRELTSEEVITIKFDSYEKAEEYFNLIDLKGFILDVKAGDMDFKRIKKRKGQRTHYCKCCKKEIIAGTYVYCWNDAYYFRGRITGRSTYICEPCWKEYIEADNIEKLSIF